ncbi:TPA: hypothetical protein TT917_001700 [Streptococcus equi subsp. zooepidemicus]|uniref:hypothetical protein n=1 Tax=Streptococcus equi TaxID=1336 RepID=UPI0005B86037|nr:hypothetical protein [Streptococcus equi]KIS05335.1 membrane protein [Streptococcus equi subsp. zooepidemicus Sz16]MDI5946038.1 hypothetical protein [Streptococcus equi subsp. zooepidemicus]HEL0022869.1 hypothetical protein [Streptococcus equi subsp. zooepidemicus]HEL0040790.1 hypothetical protein [Streptococcus equi subsp. zooepidemicus]HEL0042727.1 hypothetical protein [Streptococcus equi subsp. zooepidemicus]
MADLSISKKSLLKGLGLLSVCLGLAVGTSHIAFAHVSTFYWNRSWYLSQQNKGTDEEVEQKKKELIEKIETSRLYRFIKNNYIDTINSHVFLYKLLYLEEHIDILVARAKAEAESGIILDD